MYPLLIFDLDLLLLAATFTEAISVRFLMILYAVFSILFLFILPKQSFCISGCHLFSTEFSHAVHVSPLIYGLGLNNRVADLYYRITAYASNPDCDTGPARPGW